MIVNKKTKIKGMGSFFVEFKGGSQVEEVGERGLSHLAEHLVCKGWDHLFPEFTSLNINFNAYTAQDKVLFYWSGLDDEITKLLERKEGLKILTRKPTREEFDIEKKIVLQEYDDCFSDTDAVYYNFSRKYFNNYQPIGFRKDIEDITYEKMLEFIEDRFTKPTNILRIGSSKNKFTEEVTFLKNKRKSNIKYQVNNDPSIIEYNSTTDNPRIADWIRLEMDTRMISLVCKLWTNGLESPLKKEIREKRGLVYRLSMSGWRQGNEEQVIFDSSTKNEEEVRKVFSDIISRPEEYITPERYQNIMSCLTNSDKKNDFMNYQNYDCYMDKENYLTLDYLDKLDYHFVLSQAKIISDKFVNEIRYASAGKELVI